MIARCPECNSAGKLDDKLAGRQVRCPRCGANFVAKPGHQVKWYYAEGDNKMGPIGQEQFDRLVADGTVTPETLVWRKGMTEWQPLAELKPALPKKWYYAEGQIKKGPLAPEEFDRMVAEGAIGGETLVWCKGMAEWQPLSEVAGPAPAREKCDNCGQDFAPALLAAHNGDMVCEACKLKLLQAGRKNRLKYGSILNRFIAKVIDLLFMLAMAGMVEGLSRKLFPASYAGNTVTPVFTATLIINMLLGIFYITWFVGKFGATPGKMVVNLKITDPAGSRLGYLHAFGRYCGEFIAGLGIMGFLVLAIFWAINSMIPSNPLENSIAIAILVTGGLVYAPALFDPQRRTLYDRLCNTRVIAA